MEKTNIAIQTRFTKTDVERIDNIIKKGKYDKRSHVIRRAVKEYLDKCEEKPVYA